MEYNFDNPAERYKKSLDTKQSWLKYRNHYKAGIHRRQLIDNLTDNDDDKFNFKEKTKRDYSINSRIGKILHKLTYAKTTDTYSILDNSYVRLRKHPILNRTDAYEATVYSDSRIPLGSFEYYTNYEDYPDYIYLEHCMKDEKVPHGFFEIIQEFLYDKYQNTHKGIVLCPMNEALKRYYTQLGFELFNSNEWGDDFYKWDW